MKEPKTQLKHIALITALSIREFLGSQRLTTAGVVVHTSPKNGNNLVSQLQSLGLKVIALCHGGNCRWNENGIELDNGDDTEFKLSPVDTFSLDADVIIFDEINDYIDCEDSKNFSAGIMIETGNFITQAAKQSLVARGIEVIPHEFFKASPKEAPNQSSTERWSQYINENWKKVAGFARYKHTSFKSAFESLHSGGAI